MSGDPSKEPSGSAGAAPDKTGVCGLCHSGPMLDAANVFSTAVFGNPPGARHFNVFVSERNVIGNPLYTFIIEDTLGVRT